MCISDYTARDEVDSATRNGKITHLVVKMTNCKGEPISMIVDRTIDGDEATIRSFPRGIKTVRKLG